MGWTVARLSSGTPLQATNDTNIGVGHGTTPICVTRLPVDLNGGNTMLVFEHQAENNLLRSVPKTLCRRVIVFV